MWPPDVNSSTYLPPFLQPDGAPHFPPHPTFPGPEFSNIQGAQESIPRNHSASLCSLAGRYGNPIPTLFLAPIDCLKIPALNSSGGLGGGGSSGVCLGKDYFRPTNFRESLFLMHECLNRDHHRCDKPLKAKVFFILYPSRAVQLQFNNAPVLWIAKISGSEIMLAETHTRIQPSPHPPLLLSVWCVYVASETGFSPPRPARTENTCSVARWPWPPPNNSKQAV